MCIENKFMGIFGILFFIIGLLLLPIPTSLDYISSLGSFSFLGAPLNTIVGAFLGYKLSNKRWETQRKIQQKNTAIGFYNEIKEINKIIKPLVDNFEVYRIKFDAYDDQDPAWKIFETYRLDQVIRELKTDLNKFSSFYDKNGLYFHFRKEIYSFDDTNLVKSILKFYTNLLSADKEYKFYMNSIYKIYPNESKATDDQAIFAVQDNFVKHIYFAHKEASKLINLFEACL